MNYRHWLGLLVAFAGVVVVGIIAAWQLAQDDPTRRIAIYAAVVATLGSFFTALKNGYDFWERFQERKKKEDEKAEKVRATLILSGGGYNGMTFRVELFNQGSTRVAIKRVALCGVFKGHDFASEMAILDKESAQRLMVTPKAINTDLYPKTVTLEPKDHADFHLKATVPMPACPTPFEVKDFVGLEADSFRVMVESFNGELKGISGAEILEAIHRQLPADLPATVPV